MRYRSSDKTSSNSFDSRRTYRGLLRSLAGALCLMVAVPAITLAQAQTHAEFDVTHNELLGGATNIVVDSDPGQDSGGSLQITGSINAAYGQHDLTVRASVVPGENNEAKLHAEGEHLFTLSGTDVLTDVWVSTDSSMLARAELIDELSLSNVPGFAATVEFYWQITGQSDAVIDITPPGDLFFDFDTTITLETRTSAPHSGGSTHVETTSWGGYRAGDLDDSKFVDAFVVMTLDVDPTQDVPFEVMLEVEPVTSINNGVEIKGLHTDGLHRSSFYDSGAELIGVIIRDENGNIIPDAIIISTSGYDYPVEAEVPQPRPPRTVILSPTQVVDNDLGEYSGQPVDLMIDQTGLYVPFNSGVDGFDIYFSGPDATLADASYLYNWSSEVDFSLPLEGHVDFDLGGDYVIDRLALWNISLQDFRVQIADSATGPWTEVGQYNLASHIWYYSYNVDFLDLGGEHTARYLRLAVDSVHTAYAGDSFGYAIVGEVAVSAKPVPVPEPGMALMLVSGIGALVLLANRRQGAARVVADSSGERVHAAPEVTGSRSAVVLACSGLLALGLSFGASAGSLTDSDSDGVPDAYDNCSSVANGPDAGTGSCNAQEDYDADGYGQACDLDVDNSGSVLGGDISQVLAAIGETGQNPEDIDCSGSTLGGDLSAVLKAIGGVPGPSGLACAGSIPCP